MATFKAVVNDSGNVVLVNFDLVTSIDRTATGQVILFFGDEGDRLYIKDSFEDMMHLLLFNGDKGR